MLLVHDLTSAGTIGISIIGAPGSAVASHIVGIGLSATAGAGAYIPMGHTGLTDHPNLPERDVFARLSPMLSDASVRKTGHDLKTVAEVAARHGIDLRGYRLDTMVASYLLDATRSSHAIESLALERAGLSRGHR